MASRSAADVTVIGAGPYGLSTYAHAGRLGLRARIFGETMQTWVSHMPLGMNLKSVAAASNLDAGRPGFGLADYCREAGIQAPTGDDPVPLDLFVGYGRWFAEQLAPSVSPTRVRRVERVDGGFLVETGDGERFDTTSVVVASGLIGHAYVPPELAALAGDAAASRTLVSHSSQHADFSGFGGREVAVIGAGQSALESAALLAESGAKPTVIARRDAVRFGQLSQPGRSLPYPLRKPGSPLGPGWSLYACARGPALFRRLPANVRRDLVARILGPSGAWWLRERVVDRFPVDTGQRLLKAEAGANQVTLHTEGADGSSRIYRADHVISATGYRLGAGAFDFLSEDLRGAVDRQSGWPRLNAGFESSVPGLYFVGFPAAGSFGPLMRFVCGTSYAAPRVARAAAARSSSQD